MTYGCMKQVMVYSLIIPKLYPKNKGSTRGLDHMVNNMHYMCKADFGYTVEKRLQWTTGKSGESCQKARDGGELDKIKAVRVFKFYTYLKLEPTALVDRLCAGEELL